MQASQQAFLLWTRVAFGLLQGVRTISSITVAAYCLGPLEVLFTPRWRRSSAHSLGAPANRPAGTDTRSCVVQLVQFLSSVDFLRALSAAARNTKAASLCRGAHAGYRVGPSKKWLLSLSAAVGRLLHGRLLMP